MRALAMALIVGWLTVGVCCAAVGYTVWSRL